MLKFHTMRARMIRISMYAKLRPRQFLGPVLKGRWTCFRSCANSEPSLEAEGSQRSGINSSGRVKLAASWYAAYWLTPTMVCIYQD